MENFQLSLLFQIIGIGSASGLVFHDTSLFIISDNSSYLYEYQMVDQKLNKIALVENPKENILKKEKPDFESITLKGNRLQMYGSGSTEKRNTTISYHLAKKQVQEKSVASLYASIKNQLKIGDDELNIEGVIFKGNEIFLFQRGNGAQAKNGIITIKDKGKGSISFHPIELPKIENVVTSFTDAILVKDKIYFLAAAEDTTSTYADGNVLGSVIGSINSSTFQIEKTIQISKNNKFEGLTLYQSSEKEIEFLLCEDNDTEALNTNIYKLSLALENVDN